jgi:transcriptional regulator with XRE-family HTH domain
MKEADPRAAFGEAVRKLRLKKQFSQEKLAELAGIHRTYIGDVERGERNVSLLNMARLARALEVPLSRIVTDMEKQT